ncbi:MAG: NAD(P)-dependent oxidoreductase [Fimbriimonadales bacterium]|nr:NAD(P)-dependent oxidoreductase [Fimbriimonadales bacterium]
MHSVLITGGAGFIGRWLAKRCIEAGHTVCIVDNLSVGALENLMELEGRFEFVQTDLRETERIAQCLQRHDVQTVYHLAALHYIPYCEANPRETLEVNVLGTLSVLEAMRAAGVNRLVFASTGALYPPLDTPLTEETPLEAQDIYGLTKLHGETTIAYYQQRYGVQATIVRLFNTYGPYETNPHLLPHIINTLKQGARELTLGNLHPKRDYIYVEDVAEGFYRLGSGDAQGVFNLGTGAEYSVQEVVDTLSELLGEPLRVVQDPARMRPVDKPHQRADVAKLRQTLDWKPTVSLREGLTRWLRHEGLLG